MHENSCVYNLVADDGRLVAANWVRGSQSRVYEMHVQPQTLTFHLLNKRVVATQTVQHGHLTQQQSQRAYQSAVAVRCRPLRAVSEYRIKRPQLKQHRQEAGAHRAALGSNRKDLLGRHLLHPHPQPDPPRRLPILLARPSVDVQRHQPEPRRRSQKTHQGNLQPTAEALGGRLYGTLPRDTKANVSVFLILFVHSS
jgi:hypothetical protein